MEYEDKYWWIPLVLSIISLIAAWRAPIMALIEKLFGA